MGLGDSFVFLAWGRGCGREEAVERERDQKEPPNGTLSTAPRILKIRLFEVAKEALNPTWTTKNLPS